MKSCETVRRADAPQIELTRSEPGSPPTNTNLRKDIYEWLKRNHHRLSAFPRHKTGAPGHPKFNPGQVLFHEGDPANQFYLIESGRIALEAHEPADGTVLIETVGAGEVLGWSWLFPPFVWHFQARAVEPTKAVVLSGAHLLVAAERNHEFGYELMKRVAQVVIERLQFTRKRLLAEEIESVLKG
jgi:CRP/FNR family transcriptional regulator, cyclic AMP receptor protein